MAAATDYDDAPTDQQLLAYAEIPKFGKEMAEVFAVRVPAAAGGNRPPPCGWISRPRRPLRFGLHLHQEPYGRRHFPASLRQPGATHSIDPSSISFPHRNESIRLRNQSVTSCLPTHHMSSRHMLLSSSLSVFMMATKKPHCKKKEIFCDTCGDFPIYKCNKAIVETVETAYGPADVTYAIVTNSVQGQVSVKLSRWEGEGRTSILGSIVARSKLFNVGCVLFYNEHDKDIVCAGSEELIPLARHALAVPLKIEMDLQCDSGDKIVRGALEINPATEGQHIEHLIGMNGAEIEVKISWTEYP
ncbi:hypothetical protein EJB05_06441, partial [Eragrostis curvula]